MQIKYLAASLVLLTPTLAVPEAFPGNALKGRDDLASYSSMLSSISSEYDAIMTTVSEAAVIVSAESDSSLSSAWSKAESLATQVSVDIVAAVTATASSDVSSFASEASACFVSAVDIVTSIVSKYTVKETTLTDSGGRPTQTSVTVTKQGASIPHSADLEIGLLALAGLVGVVAVAL